MKFWRTGRFPQVWLLQVSTDDFKASRPPRIVLGNPTKPRRCVARGQLTLGSPPFTSKAFSWPLPSLGFPSSANTEEENFQLLHRRSLPPRPPKRKASADQKKNSPTHNQSHFFVLEEQYFLHRLIAHIQPSAAKLRLARGDCTCHFARGPEPHPPDTCQAGAETPPALLSPGSRSPISVTVPQTLP